MLQNRATLKQIRIHLLKELRQIYAENESDAISRLVMEHTGYPLSMSLRDPDHIPGAAVVAQIKAIVAEIRSGLPIQYVLGQTHFCDLTIKVNKHVLIPRPETEALVEHIKTMSQDPFQRIIDLGTGSGCIALALKQYYPDAEVWGVDISREALLVAAESGRNNKLGVIWGYLDLLNMHPGDQWEAFNLVVSNPPYVLNRERIFMAPHVLDHEPESALFVEDDDDPLSFYRAIATFCSLHLAEKGELWVEINETLGKESASLFKKEGFSQVRILRDIHEKERYIYARR